MLYRFPSRSRVRCQRTEGAAHLGVRNVGVPPARIGQHEHGGIANALIDAGRKMAPSLGAIEEAEDLYWRFIVAAALLPFLGLLFLRDRPELWIQTIGAIAVTVAVFSVLR